MVELDLVDGFSGEGRLEDYGRFDDAWLVVSPLAGGSFGRDYLFTAAVTTALDPPSGDDDDDDDDDGEVQAAGDGCSCRHAGSATAPASALLLTLLGLLAIRRRDA